MRTDEARRSQRARWTRVTGENPRRPYLPRQREASKGTKGYLKKTQLSDERGKGKEKVTPAPARLFLCLANKTLALGSSVVGAPATLHTHTPTPTHKPQPTATATHNIDLHSIFTITRCSQAPHGVP
jgi:hypothetical protein